MIKKQTFKKELSILFFEQRRKKNKGYNMGKLLVKEKSVVVPGEELAEGMDFLPSFGTFREKEKIIASRMGLLNVNKNILKLTPLTGRYAPKKGDKVICKVTDILNMGWRLDLNIAYNALIPIKDATSDYIARGADLSAIYDIDDYVIGEITNVTSQKLIDVSTKGPGLKKLKGGRIISINPHKVPRVIGREGSMVKVIKDITDCQILVGQNGWVWISGTEPKMELLAVEAVKKIEKESHISGLTEKIEKFLKENKK